MGKVWAGAGPGISTLHPHPMARRKTAAELESTLAMHRVRVWGLVASNAVRWISLVLIAFFAYRAIAALSGETTRANVGVRFFTDIRVSTALALGAGIGGIGYGLRQRKLRRDNIGRMARHSSALEKALDPRRSSSKLTPRGDTNPEDRI